MATHPFAIKLEEAIEKAKRARDAMKRSKAVADDEEPGGKKLRTSRLSGRVVSLGLIGLGGGPTVSDGGATHIYDMKPSPALAKLLQDLADETRKCNDSQTKVRSEGRFEVVGDKRVWMKGSTSVVGNAPCPGVRQVQKAIKRLIESGGGYILSMNR